MIIALLVIVILVFLIVIHELGHFIAAKLSKVKVEEFGVGYPPRAFTFGTFGGTEYTLNWIPFGGFVRLFGDEGEGQRGKGSLVDSPRWKQAIILVAGVAMNALAACALFAIALHIGVLEPVSVGTPHAQLIVSDVVAGSPAQSSGMEPGDTIVGISDTHGNELASLTPDGVVDFVSARGGKPIVVEYMRMHATSTAEMTPANAVVPGAAGRPALGLGLVLAATQSEPWGQAFSDGLYDTGNAFAEVASNVWTLLEGAAHGAPDLSQVVGPVGIVSYVGQAAQSGLGYVLMLAALISVNLAVINLIPIPALDGGRLVVLAFEAATRRQAPRLAIQVLNAIGIAIIILLMVVVTYHDIGRLLA